MTRIKIFAASCAISVASYGAVQAQHGSSADVLAGFEKTGEMLTCLPLRQVRDSDPLDDNAILFELRGGKMYLNELRGSCIGLGRNERFSYQTTQNKICKGDVITVANPVGTPIGSCGLGEFEELSEIPADSESAD